MVIASLTPLFFLLLILSVIETFVGCLAVECNPFHFRYFRFLGSCTPASKLTPWPCKQVDPLALQASWPPGPHAFCILLLFIYLFVCYVTMHLIVCLLSQWPELSRKCFWGLPGGGRAASDERSFAEEASILVR